MSQEQIATFINKTPIGDDMFLIEYRVNRENRIMGITKYDTDFELMQKLTSGTKFVIELKNTHIKPTGDIQIPQGIYQIPHIKQIITR